MSFRGPARAAAPTTHTFEELLKHPETKAIVNVERGELPSTCGTESRAGLKSYGKNLLRRAKSKVQDSWATMKEAIRNRDMPTVKKLVANGFNLVKYRDYKGEQKRAFDYANDKLGPAHAITTYLAKQTRKSQSG